MEENFSFQIQSLLPVRDNPHYAKLKQLIAPDNEIKSMDDLVSHNTNHFLGDYSKKLDRFMISLKLKKWFSFLGLLVIKFGDWKQL